MTDELKAALAQLEQAIRNEGPSPTTHRKTMARHRSEWPTLWAAIDTVRRVGPQA